MTERLGSVLMTSAARKVSMLRALQSAAHRLDPSSRVIAGDTDRGAPSRHVADDFWTMPRLEALDTTTLVAECESRGIQTILPTRDGELSFWAKLRPSLEAIGISVIVSSPAALAVCLDKLVFSEWGKDHDLPVIPADLRPGTFGDHPLVVKERFGAGSISLGLRLLSPAAQAHAAGLVAPIFQPFIEGPEISIDAWLSSSGRAHGLVLRRRDRVVGGESQITTTFRDERLEAQARRVLEGLGLSGPVVMQAIITEAGLAVIEVNPRFGGASTASIAVGLDLLYWSLWERLWPSRPVPEFLRSARNIRQIRVPEDIVVDAADL